MKSEKPKDLILIEKVTKVINSCKTMDQLNVAYKYYMFATKYLSRLDSILIFNITYMYKRNNL